MRKMAGLLLVCLLLLAVVPLAAQEATPEASPDAGMGAEATQDAGTGSEGAAGMGGIQVSDQIVLDGMVRARVTADAAGFLAIHATDEMGNNPHVVGVAPVAAGDNPEVAVMIDGAMATPFLTAQLHVDDTTPGVFEFGKVEGADMPLAGEGGAATGVPFKVAGIFAYDQQPMNGNLVVASVISEVGGWLVVHTDENGAPGPVLGQTLLVPGTNPAVMVALGSEGQTPVLWPMIHADDGEIGVYEFGTVENADTPLVLNDVVATRPVNATEAPTLMLADMTPLESANAPSIAASEQTFDGDAGAGVNFVVDMVVSAGPGFVDVHADGGGHPSTSLGVTPVADGENAGVTVPLMPMMGMPITPVVWPMLHSDTNANGAYEYLMIPGADLPVVYNGAVVTLPTNLGGSAVDGGMTGEATAEAMNMGEATQDAGMMEATAETTP